MRSASKDREIQQSISAVERETGISKDTLRVWERRYGFPSPDRYANGERYYPQAQVDKLRLVKQLISSGHRPGAIMRLPLVALRDIAEQGRVASPPAPDSGASELPRLMQLVAQRQADTLREQMRLLATRVGLAQFVSHYLAPMARNVGDDWAQGRIGVLEEHLFSETVQMVMREAILRIRSASVSPRVLLTTLPNEPHGLGILMAEAMFALEGCHCESLGVQTPVGEIDRAVRLQSIDIVALSCSAHLPINPLIQDLRALRGRLPSHVEIWVGGCTPMPTRRCPAGVELMQDLGRVSERVAAWREAH